MLAGGLDFGAGGAADSLGRHASTLAVSVNEQPGDRIDRYKLLQKLGEGGCGVVYMAEQEEPVRRKVALKVIKLGMDTRQVIARFEAERQALALMDHPNIAQVLDAGATDTGRPYFVMELVRGIKFTDYCDQNHLDTTQRLRLFIQICHAIQHAHQKGIIHRDIKPSNILVTLHDGVPVPKVIDFGIAKATTDQRLTDKTLFTAYEQFIGTPAYMSPEQAEMSGLDIDTRSDIYSLGVLLYELLTGRTPFDTKELLKSGLEALRKTIREKEPLKPSTRLTRDLERTGLGSARVARVESGVAPDSPLSPLESPGGERTKEVFGETPKTARGARALPDETRDVIRQLRGDLDCIVMKCLEKDRARRYETANGLARDLERHLNHEPVVACPPGRLYRASKCIRRHRVAFTATSAVAAALILGMAASTWMYFQEKQARQRADAEARKNQQLADSFRNALDIAHPNLSVGDPRQLRQVLDEAVRRLPLALANQPEVEMKLRAALIEDYENLELWQQAADLARQNVQLARAHLRPDDPALALALAQLGRDQWQLGQRAEAEAVIRQALAGAGKRLWPGDLQQSQGAVGSLVKILLPLRQPTVDDQLLHQLLTPAVEQHPQAADLLAIRGSFFARRGQWQPAAVDLTRAVQLDPANHAFYHALAPLLVADGDLDHYRQLCARILARFHGAKDPAIADRMAKDCLILPSSGVDLAQVGPMADTAVPGGHPYQLFCKGLAQYRLGRFASAVEWMGKVLTHPDRNPIRDVEADAVLALARWQLHQPGAARIALAQATQTAETQLPKVESGDLESGWIDWIIGHALLREAKSLIEGNTSEGPALQ